jgi:diguanylate cyclase (GGDEF)-like protein
LPTSDEEVAAALDALVAEGPLAVAFQPIVDLQRGEPIGYEVLGRCGPLPAPLSAAAQGPAALLALAERHGRLLALDRRWREIAVAHIAEHNEHRRLFFLNVDPRVVDDPAFVPGYTLELVERHGLSPERFVLELTEVVSQDPLAIERVLEHYARQGFRVALDDLGAGQQSLVTLLRLQPNIVKLDRELVRDVHVDASRAHLLGALAEFARRAGILLVAEGIETRGELAAVVDAGVPCGQGFLLGRPAPRPMPLSLEACETLRAEVRRSAPRAGVSYGTRDPSLPLLGLVEDLRAASSLEAMLQAVTDGAAALLGVSRVSLRLLDESRTRLLVVARTGQPLHGRGGADFVVGEGLAGWVAQHGAPLRIDHVDSDPRFAAKPGMVGAMRSFLGVPLLDDRGPIGVLATSSPSPEAFTFVDERWLRVVAAAAAPYLEVARIKRLAITDPLTSALNRRGLDTLFPRGEGRDDEPWSAGLVDIDGFKAINDRFGHPAGDDVLRGVVRAMSEVLRGSDHIVRLGGEEFLVVLPGVGLAVARAIVERLRETVAAARLLPGATITVSVGVAERRRGESCEALLRRADGALYQAKAVGRNCVIADEGWRSEGHAPTDAE